MGNLSIKKANNVINFNYWFWNNSYPSKMLDWNFVLDYDCYISIPYLLDNSADIKSIINQFNIDITDIFEQSIKDNFRIKLNAE